MIKEDIGFCQCFSALATTYGFVDKQILTSERVEFDFIFLLDPAMQYALSIHSDASLYA